ncbi:MAG: hypothetical protein Q9185_001622 [Variospora sp. 1 TL-2023]
MPSAEDANLYEVNNSVINAGIPVCWLAIIALVARVLARKMVKYPLDASDYALLSGWGFAWASSPASLLVRRSCKSPTADTAKLARIARDEALHQIYKILYMVQITYCIAITLVKISILLLYRSIFPWQHFIYPTYVVGACAVAWGIASTLVSIFSCIPVQAFWNTTITDADTRSFYLGNCIPNIVIDIMILSLPMYEVYKLQMMQLKTKIVVGCMFALGGFKQGTFTNEGAWPIVELHTAVICACLPTVRPLFRYTGHVSDRYHPGSHSFSSAAKSKSCKPHNRHHHVSLNNAEEDTRTLKGGAWGHSGNSVGRPDKVTLRDDLEREAAYNMYELAAGKGGGGLRFGGRLWECKSDRAEKMGECAPVNM